MKLKAIRLEKTDTCLSYALKRIGAEKLLPIDYDGMVSGVTFEVFGWANIGPEIGDLILWDRDLTKSLLPVVIGEDGRIVHSYMQTGLHYAVFEGADLISDSVRDNDYPIIRIRLLSDTRPDRILRWRGRNAG